MFAINEKVTAAGQFTSRIREAAFAKKPSGRISGASIDSHHNRPTRRKFDPTAFSPLAFRGNAALRSH